MAAYTTSMVQYATYWAPGANDGFGGVAYGAPVAIMCRWQDVAALVRSAQGQEVASSATVYVDRALLPAGYLALGDHTGEVDSDGMLDPLEVEGAKSIIQVGTSPSLDVALVLNKVWL
jgi:hypothetical protein